MSAACVVIAVLGLNAAPQPSTADPAPGAEPTYGPLVATDLDEAHAIGKMLRCPVCQGMPIAESPSQMAQDMMGRVRDMLREGRSRDEILEYFVERYGEWVLLAPKAAKEGVWEPHLKRWLRHVGGVGGKFGLVVDEFL